VEPLPQARLNAWTVRTTDSLLLQNAIVSILRIT
jgi:hypothetical protein